MDGTDTDTTNRVGRMGQLTERTWRRFSWILVFLSPLHSESGTTSRRENSVTQRASTAQCPSVPGSYTQLLSKLHTISKWGGGGGWGWGGWVEGGYRGDDAFYLHHFVFV